MSNNNNNNNNEQQSKYAKHENRAKTVPPNRTRDEVDILSQNKHLPPHQAYQQPPIPPPPRRRSNSVPNMSYSRKRNSYTSNRERYSPYGQEYYNNNEFDEYYETTVGNSTIDGDYIVGDDRYYNANILSDLYESEENVDACYGGNRRGYYGGRRGYRGSRRGSGGGRRGYRGSTRSYRGGKMSYRDNYDY